MQKFTERLLKALKPAEKEYTLREGKGFAIRVLPSGQKIFQYIYNLNGKRYRLSLGNYSDMSLADAHERFGDARKLLKQKINPKIHQIIDNDNTVGNLINLYLSKHSKPNKSASAYKEDERTLKKYIPETWTGRSIKDIRKIDAIHLVESIAVSTPGQARGVLKIARAMFNFALERDMLEVNPFVRLSKAVAAVRPKSRDRILTDREIIEVWQTLNSFDGPGAPSTRRALLLVLITGQRPGEVSGMHRSEILGEWWTVPWSRIKTRNIREEDHRVYLSPLALRYIGDFNGYIFPGPNEEKPINRWALSHIVSKALTDSKGNVSRSSYWGLAPWTPHDLRRTAATKLSELGCSDEIIDSILNHAKEGVIGTYNRNKYDKEKQEWLTKWSEYLVNLVNCSVPEITH